MAIFLSHLNISKVGDMQGRIYMTLRKPRQNLLGLGVVPYPGDSNSVFAKVGITHNVCNTMLMS